jgi:hypothetical protein
MDARACHEAHFNEDHAAVRRVSLPCVVDSQPRKRRRRPEANPSLDVIISDGDGDGVTVISSAICIWVSIWWRIRRPLGSCPIAAHEETRVCWQNWRASYPVQDIFCFCHCVNEKGLRCYIIHAPSKLAHTQNQPQHRKEWIRTKALTMNGTCYIFGAT